MLDRKKRIRVVGRAKKAVSVRSSLAVYLKEETNREITEGELRSLFPESYVCVECADRAVEFQKLKVK